MKECSNTGVASNWWLRLAAAGILLVGAAAAVACSDDDKKDSTSAATVAATQAATPAVTADELAVQQVFLDAIEAWNANDLDSFLTHFTDEGLISSFAEGEPDATVEDAMAGLEGFFGSQELELQEFLDTTVSGETASMNTQFSLGPTLLHSNFGLVQVEGDWKLNSEESNLPVEIPAGTPSIEVDLNEFAFGVDTAAIADAVGPFALNAKNVGKQTHMLALARIPADADIQALLQEENPEGVEFMSGVDDIAPGSSKDLVFVRPLDPGRYMMVCFLPDTDEGEEGTPHALKGMVKEFTIK